MSNIHHIYQGTPMHQPGIHAMPPWMYMMGAVTGGITTLLGVVTPAELSQWVSLGFSVVYGGIFLYGYWVRTTRPAPVEVVRRGSNMRDEQGNGK